MCTKGCTCIKCVRLWCSSAFFLWSCSYTLCIGSHFEPAPRTTVLLLDEHFQQTVCMNECRLQYSMSLYVCGCISFYILNKFAKAIKCAWVFQILCHRMLCPMTNYSYACCTYTFCHESFVLWANVCTSCKPVSLLHFQTNQSFFLCVFLCICVCFCVYVCVYHVEIRAWHTLLFGRYVVSGPNSSTKRVQIKCPL